jgi:predicted ATPase/DNA-binding CsgD family transcriptional regulator
MDEKKPPSAPLVELLTRRERAILLHLAEEKSNREIAALEVLALNSVKWYIQQIYGKLGVNKRSEAVERALSLGLIAIQGSRSLPVSPTSEMRPSPLPTGKVTFMFTDGVGDVPLGERDLPSIETTTTHPNNLPLQMTSFIGRENEIAAVRRLLADHRLVTLTGSGGTGKTRLCLQVATKVLEQYTHGAWLVELAPLADPTLVPRTVASALGVPETAGRAVRDSLVSFLRQKRLLLILDNCEHLLQACTNLADDLLHACPELTILASSREILGVEGETPFRVPAMTLPDPHYLPPLAELAGYDAIRLFVERGQVVAPGFALTADNAQTIAQVVSRLDGIPLAIELAAARLRLLSVDQIALRLNDSFRLLTGGSRTVLPRHQTLRALIDWSYNLLSDAERILLRRLSVFAGSWTLEAAEQVCADESQVQGAILLVEVLDLLGGLVDKSLILPVQEGDREVRFAMLETIRQYAHEKLVDEKEAETARTRHMQYYCRLAEGLAPKIRSQEQIETLDHLELELGNLRLALDWSLQTDIETELTLATALKWLWHIHTHWSEGIEWLERGLEIEQAGHGATPPDFRRALIRAEALSALGFLLQMQVNFLAGKVLIEKTKTCLEECIALFQASGNVNTPGYAWAMLFLALYVDQRQIQVQKALRIFRKVGDAHGTAEALMGLALCEIDPAHKRKLHQEQLEIDQANGDTEGIAAALWYIGLVDCLEAEWEHAFQTQKASLAHFQQVHNLNMLGTVSLWLAICSAHYGDLVRAGQCLNDAMHIYSELGNETGLINCWWFRSELNIAEGLLPQAAKAIEQVRCINQDGEDFLWAIRARLARLQGEPDEAHQLAQKGFQVSQEKQTTSTDILIELAYQALECADLTGAATYLRTGVQHIIGSRGIILWESFIDGLALLAVRQGKVELAVRLFGSRWWRGFFNMLSPSERAIRTAIQTEMQSLLGEERYQQLSQEGQALTFMQLQAVAQECIGLS